MPREKDGYRDVLEDLLDYFKDKRVLTITEVARYTGRDRHWCKDTYKIPKQGIHITVLARALS